MKNLKVFLLTISILLFNSCDILQQVEQMSMLSKCDFRLATVKNLSVGGVNVQNIKGIDDLRFDQAAIIIAMAAGGELPLSMTLNVEVKNPNTSEAGMNKLDWTLLIDNIEMVSGTNSDRVVIPANGGINIIPLSISVNLIKALSGRSGDALLNFGLNLAGVGDRPTRMTIKAKPTIYVAGKAIDYPGVITVNNDFGSK